MYNRLSNYNRGFSGNRELTDNELQRVAPSIFATEPYFERSKHYKFIPTIEVINALRRADFLPVKAQQSNTRIQGKKEFTKHLIRFRQRQNLSAEVNQEIPEIVLINSHDGTSAYNLLMGLFRLVCSNGLIVGDTFSKIRVIHKGDNNIQKNVIDASYEIINNAPKVIEKIDTWKNTPLTMPMQEVFAEASLSLNPSKMEIAPSRLLQYRRTQDKPDNQGNRSLWQTFNIVQENYLKGGIMGKSEKGNYRRTRAIKSIDKDVKLNKALWLLTEKMEGILKEKDWKV